MTPRRLLILVTTVTAVMTLTGCVPEPAPTPTPTGFASEEEAFAAAEETWNDYVSAVNDVDLHDPSTFESLYRLTTGDFNADVREEYSEKHAEGWTTAGAAVTKAFRGLESNRSQTQVIAYVCLDVSKVEAFDKTGSSVIDPDRRDEQELEVIFVLAPSGRTLSISDVAGYEGEAKCN